MFNLIVKYTNNSLASSGLTLSSVGEEGIRKRLKLPENQGGYTEGILQYIKDSV